MKKKAKKPIKYNPALTKSAGEIKMPKEPVSFDDLMKKIVQVKPRMK